MRTEITPLDGLEGDALRLAAERLSNGAVAVFPTDTVYGLGTAAGSASGIEKIYQLKGRTAQKPLQLLCSGFAAALPLAEFTPEAALAAMRFWPGALTMVLNALPPGKPYCRNRSTLGLRVPAYAPLCALIEALGQPLAATSANISGEPCAQAESAVSALFGGKADYQFTGQPSCLGESTVMDFTGPQPRVLREGSLKPGIVLSYLKNAAK